MKLLNYALIATVISSLFATSCIRRDDTDWTFEQDNAIASELFQDTYKQVDETAQSEGGLKNGPTVTFSAALGTFPNTATLDFGTSTVGLDARTRSGKIEATFSGPWRDAGTTVTLRFTDYQVKSPTTGKTYSIANGSTVTISNDGNTGVNSALRYSVAVADGQISDGENSISWNGTTTYDLVDGATTTFQTNGVDGITDDVYHIGGSVNGVNRNGTPYTTEITEYLVRDLSCRWITAGKVELTPENGSTRSVDFGDGSCDADATFSFGDWDYNFKLP